MTNPDSVEEPENGAVFVTDKQLYAFLYDFENRLRWLELQARLTKEEFDDLLRSKG